MPVNKVLVCTVGGSHEPIGSTPEELATTVQRDLKTWAKVARDSGINAE